MRSFVYQLCLNDFYVSYYQRKRYIMIARNAAKKGTFMKIDIQNKIKHLNC